MSLIVLSRKLQALAPCSWGLFALAHFAREASLLRWVCAADELSTRRAECGHRMPPQLAARGRMRKRWRAALANYLTARDDKPQRGTTCLRRREELRTQIRTSYARAAVACASTNLRLALEDCAPELDCAYGFRLRAGCADSVRRTRWALRSRVALSDCSRALFLRMNCARAQIRCPCRMPTRAAFAHQLHFLADAKLCAQANGACAAESERLEGHNAHAPLSCARRAPSASQVHAHTVSVPACRLSDA